MCLVSEGFGHVRLSFEEQWEWMLRKRGLVGNEIYSYSYGDRINPGLRYFLISGFSFKNLLFC
jgi:hypothetical protein